ncbi:MAG: glycosyl transferase, partial [Caenispirillum bisanense]|nr:glycosyl transferase [Caenispirillum bisanense]
MMPAYALPLFAAVAAAVVLATGVLLGWLRRRQILDRPNERSSHSRPTPRGGGLAVMAVVLPAWAVA